MWQRVVCPCAETSWTHSQGSEIDSLSSRDSVPPHAPAGAASSLSKPSSGSMSSSSGRTSRLMHGDEGRKPITSGEEFDRLRSDVCVCWHARLPTAVFRAGLTGVAGHQMSSVAWTSFSTVSFMRRMLKGGDHGSGSPTAFKFSGGIISADAASEKCLSSDTCEQEQARAPSSSC